MNEAFRSRFIRYLRSGQLALFDKLLIQFVPKFVYRKNAGNLSGEFRNLNWPAEPALPVEVITVEKYAGSNPVVLKIAEHLRNHIDAQLFGAYVHGSTGSGEEVAYSDFDGLIILKSGCLRDAHTLRMIVRALKESERMMFEMDPLQHHGWFVLLEEELTEYPEYYFPHVLYNHAKCILGNHSVRISLRKSGYDREFRMSFQHLADSVLRKLEKKDFLENYYAFKNLLSEFMLLPAMYIQASTGRGVFKKFSFGLLEMELGEKCAVMDAVSAIRKEWTYRPPGDFQKIRLADDLYSGNRHSIALSGPLPDLLKTKFSNEMLYKMEEFVNILKKRLSQ